MPSRMQAASYIWREAFLAFWSSARRSLTFASSSSISRSSSSDLLPGHGKRILVELSLLVAEAHRLLFLRIARPSGRLIA